MKKVVLSLLAVVAALGLQAQTKYSHYYKDLPCAVEQVQEIVIPDYTVTLTDFGAVGDGKTDCSEAFAQALKHLKKQGGGHLIVPNGRWLTGPIKLISNFDLHLEDQATIVFSPNRELYVQPSDSLRDGSKKCYALIHGSKLENVAITGRGTLDGQGIYWRPVKQKKVDEEIWDEVNAMGGVLRADGDSKNWKIWYPYNLKKEYNVPNIASDPIIQEKMRPHLVNITDSKNVLLENVHLLNSPKFHFVPTRVQNLIVDGVNIRCPHWAQNGDAMDPGNVQVALIVNCNISCGDDGICMKGGVAEKGVEAGPQRDFLITNDTVYAAHGGFVIGSEFSGGMQRLVVKDCYFDGTDIGCRFKSAPGRGGWCEDIYCQNIIMKNMQQSAILISSGYADKGAGVSATDKDKKDAFFPDWSNITFRNITCVGSKQAVDIQGLKGKPVHHILFDNVMIIGNKNGVKLEYAEDINFVNCQINPKPMPVTEYKKIKNVLYNGKDPDAAD
ncbi:MAG: glycoside hydrolase family 28 protein [Paludibacteraceae bacterium]|nr:glycoside hydrolase family 28 protein [Paludibacteraceae bacterium]